MLPGWWSAVPRSQPISERRTRAVPWLSPRPRAGHKGDFGRVLVAAGSRGMPGAAWLCAEAAARAGAGLVKLAVPESLLSTMGARVTVQTLAGLPATAAGSFAAPAAPALAALARAHDAVALGPGLGTEAATVAFARAAANAIEAPLVLDADGLNAFAGEPERLARRRAPTVLTPHPGEAARLLGISVESVQARRVETAMTLARRASAVVNLKGAGSVVTDGKRVFQNTTGNPGMASGGSGDVLTGVVVALLARGLAPFEATVLAAHVHGRAGDLAAARLGEDGLLATDLLPELPRALRERVRRR